MADTVTREGKEIPQSWLTCIEWVKEVCPEGTITIKVARGCPTELVEAKPKVRFDKGALPVKLAKI